MTKDRIRFLPAAAGALAALGLCGLLMPARVHPRAGRVVHARSGRPLSGIEVGFLAEHRQSYIDASRREIDLVAHRVTDEDGRFSMPGARSLTFRLLRESEAQRLFVNVRSNLPEGWSAAPGPRRSRESLPAGSGGNLGYTEDDFHDSGPNAPVLDKDVPDRRFFPLEIYFERDCGKIGHRAAVQCLPLDRQDGITIPLIPVPERIEDCGSLPQAESRRRCRESSEGVTEGAPEPGTPPRKPPALDPEATPEPIARARSLRGFDRASMLAELLRGADERVQDMAVADLIEMGEGAAPGLFRVWARYGQQTSVRAALVRAGPKAIPMLLPLVTLESAQANGNVAEAAAETLGQMGPGAARAVPSLLGLLRLPRDSHSYVRIKAMNAAAAIGPDADPPVSALTQALRDETWDVRYAAAVLLGGLGPRAQEAIPALREALKDPQRAVRSRAADALGLMGEKAIPVLVAAIHHEDTFVRSRAADGLVRVGRAAEPVLRAALADPDDDVRSRAKAALGRIPR